MFPNTFAAWRLNEISALMEHYLVDILVMHRVHRFANVSFKFEFEALKESQHLKYYQILTFNTTRSSLYMPPNTLPFQRDYNGALKADYMLRPSIFEGHPVDLTGYDFIYHIFYMNYANFISRFGDILGRRHLVHLYPGGGLYSAENLTSCCHSDTHLIVAQPFIDDWLNTAQIGAPRLQIYGGYFITPCQEDELSAKPLKTDLNLTISFASVGNLTEKGADTYVKIAERYHTKYPNDVVTFIGIGNVPDSKAVVKMPAMPQEDLNRLYSEHIDIAFNLERTELANGWPLGAEALVAGCLLFSTDKHNMNEKTGFKFGEELFIVEEKKLNKVLERLHELYLDPNLLHRLSVKSQERARSLFGYQNTMGKVISYMDDIIYSAA